ncbi:MAG: energy transducer TonB [Candidatus Coatesbacteria bacterium]
MSASRPGFAVFLGVSVVLHLAAAGALRAGIGTTERAGEEMVIDLTGSFRTRAVAQAVSAPPPAPVEAAGRDVSIGAEPSRDATIGQGAGEDEEAGDPAAPLVGITALPELKDRGALREKLERYYPPEARARGIEGVVTLEVVVSSRGRIVSARAVRADPAAFAAEFSGAAVSLARELEFTPAYLGARPVAVRIRLPVRFEIER